MTPSHESLQKKILKLSIDIDDKTNKYALLQEKIRNTKEIWMKNRDKEKQKFKDQLLDLEVSHNDHKKIVVEECNRLVAEKISFAKKLENSIQKRKVCSISICKIILAPSPIHLKRAQQYSFMSFSIKDNLQNILA